MKREIRIEKTCGVCNLLEDNYCDGDGEYHCNTEKCPDCLTFEGNASHINPEYRTVFTD